MPERQIDPARLEGEALMRWYLRSPAEIEEERKSTAAQRYQEFFAPDAAQATRGETGNADPSPQSSTGADELLWIANGSGGYRAIRPGSQRYFPDDDAASADPSQLPSSSAAPEDGEFFDIGNPHNPRLRREWEKANGKPWPRTDDGRRHHVSHKLAIGDGGTNTLDNIEPMDPDEHMKQHREKGDFVRWGSSSRSAAAPAQAPPATSRTSGLSEEVPITRMSPARPSAGPVVRSPKLGGALAVAGILSDLFGFASGRLRQRTDTWDNYRADLLGQPSLEDLRKADEDLQRRINPKWKPGDPYVT